MEIFDSLHSLERLLDYHLTRHGVLTSNLTNAETPGYKSKDITFSEELASAGALRGTDQKHLGTPQGGDAYQVTVQDDASTASGNAVSLEKEMAKIAANRLRYEAGIEIARRRIGLLRYAATDGQG